MKWFLVHLCDEDTVNTSTTYQDLIQAKDDAEAWKLASLKWDKTFICIGVKSVSDEEVERLLQGDQITLMSR